MRVVVEIMTGTLFYIQVGENATLADLKREIVLQEKLPQDRLILMLSDNHSRLMEEAQVSLVDYGVRDGSHFYLFFDPLDNDDDDGDYGPTHHSFLPPMNLSCG